MSDKKNQGWGSPLQSRKWHYFVGVESLCGRWWFGGYLDDAADEHPDNCKECARKRAKMKAQEPTTDS